MTYQQKGPASAEAGPQNQKQTIDASKLTRKPAKLKPRITRKALAAELQFLLAAKERGQ